MKSLLHDDTGTECDESPGKDFTPPTVKKSKLSLRRKRRAPADTKEDKYSEQLEKPAQSKPAKKGFPIWVRVFPKLGYNIIIVLHL